MKENDEVEYYIHTYYYYYAIDFLFYSCLYDLIIIFVTSPPD